MAEETPVTTPAGQTGTGDAAPAAGTAPAEKQTAGTPSSEVESGKASIQQGKEQFAFGQLRHERTELKRALEEREKKLAEVQAQYEQQQKILEAYGLVPGASGTTVPTETTTAPSGLTKDEVARIVEEKLQRHTILAAKEDAYSWLLNQGDVTSKDHIKEIQETMKRYSLDKLSEIDPYAATELAYEKWKSERQAKAPGGSGPSKEALAGGVPSGPTSPSNGAPKLTPEIIKAMPDAEFQKRKEELWAAAAKL